MDQLIQALSSPGWWISVVAVSIVTGVVASLISHYTTPKIDKLLSKVSQSWRLKSEIRSKVRQDEVNWILSSEHRMILYSIKITRVKIHLFKGLFLISAIAFGLVELGNTAEVESSIHKEAIRFGLSMIGFALMSMFTYFYIKRNSQNEHMMRALNRAVQLSIRLHSQSKPTPPGSDGPESEPVA